MSRKSLIPLILGWVLVAGPALAEEVVHFKNGTTMVIESHSIEDGSVVVNLGGDALMAFPQAQIDKIMTARGEVAIPRAGANQMMSRPPGSAGVVRGSKPPRHRRGSWRSNRELPDNESIERDRNGMAVYKPFGPNAPKNKQGVALTGRRELLTRTRVGGAANSEGKRRLPTPDAGPSRVEAVEVTLREVSAPPKKKDDKK